MTLINMPEYHQTSTYQRPMNPQQKETFKNSLKILVREGKKLLLFLPVLPILGIIFRIGYVAFMWGWNVVKLMGL